MRNRVHPRSASRYANGDLLVVFQSTKSFPYGQGVARINREGWSIWERWDYSHHEPHITGEGVALVPSLRIGRGPLVDYALDPLRGGLSTSQCENSFLDFVHVIDGEGRLLKESSIIDRCARPLMPPFCNRRIPATKPILTPSTK